jgi:predicted nucleotidyltransferase
LQEALEALLECKVDLATPNGLHARIRDAVLSEARAL